MNTSTLQETTHASPLAHELGAHFAELARFRSTKELEASPLYARLRAEVERVLNGVERGDFTHERAGEAANACAIRATAWNIERGQRLEGVVSVLREPPLMSESDVLLLTELDYGMARSGNLHVTKELARALGAAYAFAPCYINLSKGSGLESGAEGENGLALHGNAVLSRWPILRAWSVALPNGKDKMKGNEKRLGRQRAGVRAI